MKTDLTLQQLAEVIADNKANKVDYIATTNTLRVFQRGADLGLQMTNDDVDERFGINQLAHKQIGSYTGIPRVYYERMFEEVPDLLAQNINRWFEEKGERRMVRTLRGNTRAFLSSRYRRIENEDIAEMVIPILAKINDVRYESTSVTERKMYIKAVTPRVKAKVVGDQVCAGIAISNSEVGAGAVRVEPLVYTLACMNGMIVNSARYKARHVGGQISNDEDIVHLLSDEAVAADDRAILLKVRDVVNATLTDDVFKGICEKLEASYEDKIKGDIQKSVEVLTAKVGLTQTEGSSVLRHLIEGKDLSRYGMLNAVTRASQDVTSYDRATELEMVGGEILEMPKASWKDIAEAA